MTKVELIEAEINKYMTKRIDTAAPKEIAEEVAETLYKCMLKAGAFFCRRCKLDADTSRLEDGTLPNFWIH